MALVVGPVALALAPRRLLEGRWPRRRADRDLAQSALGVALTMSSVTLLTVAAPLGMLANDAAEWVSHWPLHRVGPLRRLHRLHHEDEQMN